MALYEIKGILQKISQSLLPNILSFYPSPASFLLLKWFGSPNPFEFPFSPNRVTFAFITNVCTILMMMLVAAYIL